MSDFDSEFRRANRYLNLFVALPGVIVAGLYGGGYVPERWRNLYYLVLLLAVVGTIFTVPIREQLRLERRSGLVPKRAGFSGRLEVAAEKLREYAADLEENGAEEAIPAAGLESYIRELRRVALAQDGRALVPKLVVPIDENAGAARVQKHVAQLRAGAGELEIYAQQVRAKGGIFRLNFAQRLMGGAVVVGAVFWGVRLMLRTWAVPSWAFFGGVLLVASGCMIGYGLVLSQRETA